MSRDLVVLMPAQVEGGVVSTTAVLDGEAMCSMNFAREEFNKLERMLWPLIEPLLRQQENGPASDVARHLEQIRIFSGNFCWKHRDVGSAWGEVGKRPGTDD